MNVPNTATHLKMVQIVNFMLRAFYHNKTLWKKDFGKINMY